jgi:hypothetical protein
MRIFRKLWIAVILIPLFFLWFSSKKFEGWTHLELGAGNYGPDGHTQTSQKKTVLMRLRSVSNAKNYIDELEEKGKGDYKPEDQYGVLFGTLDQLVIRNGPVGVFHVNDLYEEYASFAVDKLKKYAQEKGYRSVIIEPVSGDYQKINPRKYLSKYGRKKYDSLHLKNPEVSLYHDEMDGDDFRASAQVRQATRSMLKNLANLSTKGLFLFIIYHKNFIPVVEQKEFAEKGIFYQPTSEWESVPYIFPEGEVVPEKCGKVFLIEP